MSDQAVVRQTAELLGSAVERDVVLASFTTYKIGGPADLFVRAQSVSQLLELSGAVASTGIDVFVIGQGSNLLIADDGWRGLVVLFDGAEFDTITVDDTRVVAGAAVKLPVLARRSAAAGISGLEWMVGVPGSVGGAIRMNAGGHGSDCAANLQSVHTIDLRAGKGLQMRPAANLHLGYRTSSIAASEVVVDATFDGTPGNPDASEEVLREIVRWRRANQPGGANCGSVFTNPTGDSAGRLIDAAGLKGLRVGTAFVSDKHANFIQADPHARAADVWALIETVRRTVFERTGIALHPEVRTIGFDAQLAVLDATVPAPHTGPPTRRP